jgi:hypothetical protein
MNQLKFKEKEINDQQNSNLNYILENLDYNLCPQIDGVSIGFETNKVTALFMISKSIIDFKSDFYKDFSYYKENYNQLWETRENLANTLDVPLFVIAMDDKSFFHILIKDKKNNYALQDIMPLADFIGFVEKYRQKQLSVTKKVKLVIDEEEDIQDVFSKIGISFGGNIDSIKENQDKSYSIFEFRRKGKEDTDPNISGYNTINFSFETIMKKEEKKWKSLSLINDNINKKQDCKLNVIVWNSLGEELKVFENCDFKSGNFFEKVYTLKNNSLISYKNKTEKNLQHAF